MPEGPEVRRLADDIGALLRGSQLTAVDAAPRGVMYDAARNPAAAAELRAGRPPRPVALAGVRVHGKLLWLELEGAPAVIRVKLNTDGWLVAAPQEPRGAQVRFSFRTPEGAELLVWYVDTSRRGRVNLDADGEGLRAELAGLGPDPLALDRQDYVGRVAPLISASRRTVPLLLLDQSVAAGVGNYLRAEIVGRLGWGRGEWERKRLEPAAAAALAGAVHDTAREFYENPAAARRVYQNPSAEHVDMPKGRRFYFRSG